MTKTKSSAARQTRASNRFGLGQRPDENSGGKDPRGWLESQLSAGSEAVETRFPGGDALPSLEERKKLVESQRRARMANDSDSQADARRQSRQILGREFEEVLSYRVRTDTPFVERLVAFWSNHLCVSTTAQPAVPWVGDYERRAIRPNIFASYSDLVLASARHPAMLFYLDNFRSVGPDSMAAKGASRRDRTLGLNENYARELLELHTVGVDGGYDQSDVEQLAQIFTGWTIGDAISPRRRPSRGGRQRPGAGSGGRAGRPRGGRQGGMRQQPGQGRGMYATQDRSGDAEGEFAFIPMVHQPGAKTVMGKRFAESGEDEGIAAIRYLCSREQTAHFVATKLARHFVADDPPAKSVEKLARVFRTTGGDLLQVSKALIHLDAAWDEDNRKFRTPQDWLLAILRASGIDRFPQPAIGALRALRHTPWNPNAPIGYSDQIKDWADSASLMNRAEMARSLASSPLGRRLSLEELTEIARQATDPAAEELASLLTNSDIERNERIALALASPTFQWR